MNTGGEIEVCAFMNTTLSHQTAKIKFNTERGVLFMSNCTSKKYILDFSECNYLGEIHQRIQTDLELPDWYGQNLDALWDSITGIMYLPAEITIIFQPQTIQALQLSEEVDKIITVFKEAANEFGEIVLNIVK